MGEMLQLIRKYTTEKVNSPIHNIPKSDLVIISWSQFENP